MLVVFSPILSLIFTESSPYETPHDGVLEWECTVCLCPIKSSLKLIVPFPLRILNENEKLEKYINHNHLQRNNPASLSKCTIFGFGLSLLGVEFVRGRDCQGPRGAFTRPVYIESRVCVVKEAVMCSFEY